jgi:hypothetical protein
MAVFAEDVASLDDALVTLGVFVSALDADRLDAATAVRLVELFTLGARLCHAGRITATKRVVDTNAWSTNGHRSPREWLASQTKSSASASEAELATSSRLAQLPDLDRSLRAGRISTEQAIDIAEAATADPGAEEKLVAEAESASLKRTRKSCYEVKAAVAKDRAEDRQRIHRSRYFRHWTSSDGAFEGRFRITGDHGATVLSALEIERQRAFEHARADGQRETGEAYLADAFVNLARNTLHPEELFAAGERAPDDQAPPDTAPAPDATRPPARQRTPDPATSDAPPPAPAPPGTRRRAPRDPCPTCHRRPDTGRAKAEITVRIDHAALVRGHTEAGEICEIEGIGPVPVETVRAAASDAILRAVVIRNGHVIKTAPAGRTIPADLRRLLHERDGTCVVPGCDNRHHLEIHHLLPYAQGGPTTPDNTARVCPTHHDQITYGNAVLSGPPGHWTWTPPRTTNSPPPHDHTTEPPPLRHDHQHGGDDPPRHHDVVPQAMTLI